MGSHNCIFAVACAAWTASLSSMAGAAPRMEFIDPQLTDPAMRELTELPGASAGGIYLDHLAGIDAAVSHRNVLLVFLPGSGGVPADYQLIAGLAASEGFHVVSLIHPNWPAIEAIQVGNDDPNLPEAVHRERIYGEDATGEVDVPFTDSIIHRLTAFIAYLDQRHPTEGWYQFLTPDGQPRWRAMVWGGHSQGGEHVGYLTRERALGGAVYWSSPGDFLSYNPITPAPWDYRAGQVSAARQFGLVHQREPAEQAWLAIQNLFGLGQFGPLTNVDDNPAPYGHVHELMTNLAPAVAGAFHSSTAVDRAVHRDPDGRATLTSAWRYMMQGAAPVRCYGDFNDDGLVDFFDYLDFVDSFATSAPASDFNNDRTIDFFDYLDFVEAFASGC